MCGSGYINKRQKNSTDIQWDGRDNSITIEVPPLGMSVWKCERVEVSPTHEKKHVKSNEAGSRKNTKSEKSNI